MTGRNKIKKLSFFSRFKKSIIEDYQLYILILPALAYIIIFNYLPMYGLQIAFLDYTPSRGFDGSEFVGLEYFEKFFTSYQFWPTIINTLSLSFYGLIAGFLPPIILAILLNNCQNRRFKSVVQTITYAPYFISVVVLVSMIILMLSPSSGVINSVVKSITGKPIDFMGDPELFPHVYVISNIWQQMGWSSIIYLATLVSVSPDLYEAAKVDGASRFKQIIHIELPSILPTAIIMLILACGRIMDMSMQKVLLMQNPMNLETSEIISTYVYKQGILNLQYSYSAAVGLFQSLVNVVLLVCVNTVSRKVSDTSLW